MATTLIDTRKSIMEQIHASWNQFRTLDYAYKLLGFQYPQTCKRFLEPMAKDFKKDNAPWSIKQSVLERNAVHANKLIRLYIALNIETKKRMHIWQFFEVNSGVVGRIKEEIAILKRIQKVLKLERELEVHEPLPSATSLYSMTGNLSLYEIEEDFKVKVEKAKKLAKKDAKKLAKDAKKLAKEEAKAIKNAKKIALKAYKQVAKIRAKAIAKAEKAQAKVIAKEAEKRKKLLAKIDAKYPRIQFDREGCSIEYLKKLIKDIPSLIAADKELDRRTKKEEKVRAKAIAKAEKAKAKEQNKLGKKLAKKTIALLKWAQENDFTMDDIVNSLEVQLKDSRSDDMVTIIDIA